MIYRTSQVTPLVAALGWVTALVVEPAPFNPQATLLVGVGLLVMSAVAVVGMVVTAARWANALAVAAVGLTLVLALIRQVDELWWVALVVSTTAGAALFSPTLTRGIRKLPGATGPPPGAVVPPLILLSVPALIGLATPDSAGAASLAVGLSAPVAALGYVRVLPGGLWGVRVIWPLLALALSPALEMPGAVVATLMALVVAGVSWRPEVKASYHPPKETGSTFPIPPELTPPEILDAAGIDDKGHRK